MIQFISKKTNKTLKNVKRNVYKYFILFKYLKLTKQIKYHFKMQPIILFGMEYNVITYECINNKFSFIIKPEKKNFVIKKFCKINNKIRKTYYF